MRIILLSNILFNSSWIYYNLLYSKQYQKNNSIKGKIQFSILDLPTLEIEQKQYATVYGEDITLICNVNADPAITHVYWERVQNETSMIINQGSVGVQGITPQNPSMIIISVTNMHIGKYRCFASNAVGTSGSESMSLSVIGGKLKYFILFIQK